MDHQFARTEMLLGKEAMNILAGAYVAIFGVGGVGGYAAEALARSGIGNIDLIDSDQISITNLNRQIIATHNTIGKYKVDVMEKRMLEINPDLNINTYKTFFLPENKNDFNFSKYSYIIDAVDTVTAKIVLAQEAEKMHIPVISSMGAGNKLNPTAFEVTDIYRTSVCPLAKVMRRELKKRGVRHLKVVYSKEQPICPVSDIQLQTEHADLLQEAGCTAQKRQIPGSVAFVPSVAGLILAGEVIKDLISGVISL